MSKPVDTIKQIAITGLYLNQAIPITKRENETEIIAATSFLILKNWYKNYKSFKIITDMIHLPKVPKSPPIKGNQPNNVYTGLKNR